MFEEAAMQSYINIELKYIWDLLQQSGLIIAIISAIIFIFKNYILDYIRKKCLQTLMKNYLRYKLS